MKPYPEEDLTLVVDSILLLGAAVGIADGAWTKGEAGAPLKLFERAVAASRSDLVRQSLFFFHDHQENWMSYSTSPITREANKQIMQATASNTGSRLLSRAIYKPVAKIAGIMLKRYDMHDRMRVVALAWTAGLATVESDRPFFGSKRTDNEMGALAECAEDLAISAETTLRDCLDFVDAERG